jgi:hypothetical protein
VAILVAMACFFIPVGLWGFGRAERYAKRTASSKGLAESQEIEASP